MSRPGIAPAPSAPSRMRRLAQWWPLLLLLAAGGALYAFGAQHVLSLEMLRDRQAGLEQVVALHPVPAALAFVAATAAYLLLSLPAEGVLTAAGGMFFGTALGSALSVAGTVLAALVLFSAFRGVLRRHLSMPRAPRLERIRQRLESDGVCCLVVLRLLPVLPFALVSLLAVLVRMRARPYALATVAGAIPPTVVFASAGTGLGALLAQDGPVDVSGFLSGRILFPLVGLAALALLPVARRRWLEHAARKRQAGGPS